MQYIQQPHYSDQMAPTDSTANQWVNNNEQNNLPMAPLGIPMNGTQDTISGLSNVSSAGSGDTTTNAVAPSSYNQKTSERMRLDEGKYSNCLNFINIDVCHSQRIFGFTIIVNFRFIFVVIYPNGELFEHSKMVFISIVISIWS